MVEIKENFVYVNFDEAKKDYFLEKFENKVFPLVSNQCSNFVLEMTPVTILYSKQIGKILQLHKLVQKEGGKVIFINPNQKILETLDILGISQIFPYCDNLDDAEQFLS